jgi:hypothetical protein
MTTADASRASWGLGGVILVALALPAVATADDFSPPTWRGWPGTTLYHWVFDTGVKGVLPAAIAPDGPLGPVTGNGGPSSAWATPSQGIVWDWVDKNGNGSYDAGSDLAGWANPNPTGDEYIDLDLPNWIDDELYKGVWIQITYEGSMGQSPYVQSVTGYEG